MAQNDLSLFRYLVDYCKKHVGQIPDWKTYNKRPQYIFYESVVTIDEFVGHCLKPDEIPVFYTKTLAENELLLTTKGIHSYYNEEYMFISYSNFDEFDDYYQDLDYNDQPAYELICVVPFRGKNLIYEVDSYSPKMATILIIFRAAGYYQTGCLR